MLVLPRALAAATLLLLQPGTARASGPEAMATGDWNDIVAKKQLRVLVPGSGEQFLPRAGMPASFDRELALDLGKKLGVEIKFVMVESYDQLLSGLNEGKGDLVAAQLTVTEARKQKVAFTRATFSVDEVLVAKKGATDVPKSVAELAGREIHVRPSSAYAETLKKLAEKDAPGIKIVAAPESLDTEAIVYEVTKGQRPLTVVDSHLLQGIEAYNPDIQRLFVIATDRPIAWAVRKTNPKLKSVVDGFLIEKAMTKHTLERFDGDLDGIKKRKSIRVLTRNNAVNYFLYRGEQYGFEFELAKMIAKELGIRLEMVVVPSRDMLIPWLREGRGDVIAAAFTRTPDREKEVMFSKPYLFVEEMLVRKIGAHPEVKTPADLKGARIHVRRSSSYFRTLTELKKTIGDFTIVEEPEKAETEEIIQKVAEGVIPFTVADSHILEVERTYRRGVEGVFPLAVPGATETKQEIAFAVRQNSKALKAFLDEFVKRTYRGVEYNMTRKRYFENTRQIHVAKDLHATRTGELSPYDKFIRLYSTNYGFDWRLLAAQAYAESRFDPNAKSWVGAVGLFQVMPKTGEELGFTNLLDVDQGVHAGVKYVDQMVKRFDDDIDFRQRVRFALAAYNVGLGHVQDARRIAAEQGLDPNRWFGNVEKAMLLLEKPEFAKRARHGYCRGSEPVSYVSKIQSSYDAYVKLLPP